VTDGQVSRPAGRGRPTRGHALAVIAGAATLAATGAGVALARETTGGGKGAVVPVGLGDIVKVAGAPIGCAIRRQGAAPALDCRRIGPLRGTYGTILTARRVLVLRFVDRTTATVVFTARHGRLRAHTCG
jgi:hypothetical protein